MWQYPKAAALAALLSISAVHAESPPPFPEFSAKRVKAPTPGSASKRITVQIEPEVEPPVLATDPTEAADVPVARNSRYDWFWTSVSPDIAQGGPGRLESVLGALAQGQVRAPRLQAMQDLARRRGIDILRATIGTEVSPALVLAVMMTESAGDPVAVSKTGAQGLMQLMPDTAARFGVIDPLEPGQNIRGGVRYLDWLMRKFDRDPVLVLAGYNAGEGAVQKHAGVPPYAETRDYVPKVLAAFKVARGLCLTPPELISDGCVFAGMN